MANATEVWLPIKNYEGRYEVSNFGRVKSLTSGRQSIMRGSRFANGMQYKRVTLTSKDGIKATKYIHILVLETFIGPRPNGSWGLHNDGNVINCHLSNLRWGTSQENSLDRIKHGNSLPREKNPNAKLKPEEIKEIRHQYVPGIVKQSDLAIMFGVSQVQISRIIRNSSWR